MEIRVKKGVPAVVLAPMEGVTDAPMRALLTEIGGFDYCVSEFLRVSHEAPPPKVFLRHVPELEKGCLTPSGTPIQIQILGGDPEKMARAAQVAVGLGAGAIDINFGCPAQTVNRHDGGATLLKYPDRIRDIVSSIRQAVPTGIAVSAKLRLGWDCVDSIFLNAEKAEIGGADWITIHARTKEQGYQPPVHWKIVGEVRKRLGIPVIANGDIWNREDFERCWEETGCEHFMLGRGALADPSLPRYVSLRLSGQVKGTGFFPASLAREPGAWFPLVDRFKEISLQGGQLPIAINRRVKQWLRISHRNQELPWFDTLKRHQSLEETLSFLSGSSPG